jgi:hypothetical protein
MNRKEMRDQVQFYLGLQDVVGSDTFPGTYNETNMIDGLLHQGAIDMLSRTRCVVRCIHLRTLPDVAIYTLDHSVLGLVEVGDAARRRRRDETARGFTLIRADILQLHPIPTVAGEVEVWAVMRPQKMVADTDSPSMEQFGAIPDEYHDAIVTYAKWKGGDYADDNSSAAGEQYRILYEGQDGNGRLSQIRSSVNLRGTGRFARSRVSGLKSVPDSSAWVG